MNELKLNVLDLLLFILMSELVVKASFFIWSWLVQKPCKYEPSYLPKIYEFCSIHGQNRSLLIHNFYFIELGVEPKAVSTLRYQNCCNLRRLLWLLLWDHILYLLSLLLHFVDDYKIGMISQWFLFLFLHISEYFVSGIRRNKVTLFLIGM